MNKMEQQIWEDTAKAFTEEQWKVVLQYAPRNLILDEMNERLYTSELLTEHYVSFKSVVSRREIAK